jgi:hypothetical protein
MSKQENTALTGPATPQWYLELEARYLEALQKKNAAEAEVDKIKATLLGMMETENVKSIATDLTTTTYVAATTSRKFNSTDFKKDHPDLYEQYATKYAKGSYLQIKMKELMEE